MTLLVALAGQSRSGKGTCARVFAEEAARLGKTSFERQLSDNGKWSLARIFRPTISRVDAVAWWEELKTSNYPVSISVDTLEGYESVPLQKFLQHGLQQGGRDIFGADLWTDRLIAPTEVVGPQDAAGCVHHWLETFFDDESGLRAPTHLAIISDLRQPNEARRVQDLGGLVIECYRPTVADPYRTGADHVTELRLPSELVDVTITNARDLDRLRECARATFEHHIAPRL